MNNSESKLLQDDARDIEIVVAAICDNAQVTLFSIESGLPIRSFNLEVGNDIHVRSPCLICSPDGLVAIYAINHKIITILVESNDIKVIIEANSPIVCLDSNSDCNRVVACDKDGVISLWNPLDGTPIWSRHPPYPVLVCSVHFNSESSMIVSNTWHNVVVLDADSGGTLHQFVGHSNTVKATAFSPNSNVIASGSIDGSIRLWNIYRKLEILIIQQFDRPLVNLRFSPDGCMLASTHYGAVMLWNASSGLAVSCLDGFDGWVYAVEFSEDSTKVIAGGADKRIRIGDVCRGVVTIGAEASSHAIRNIQTYSTQQPPYILK